MPKLAISANLALVAASFCDGNGRALERIRWPLVLIACCTACLGRAMSKFGMVTSGNSARSLDSVDGLAVAANARPVIRDRYLVRCRGVEFNSSGCTSLRFRMSTSSELCVRKSAPMRGLFTSAARNFHSYARAPIRRRKFFSLWASDTGAVHRDEFPLEQDLVTVLIGCRDDTDLRPRVDQEGFIRSSVI